MMQRICYVKFDASDKEYSYFCGHLDPKPGTKVVVQTADGRLKLVSCVSVADSPDSWTNKPIYAILYTQAEAQIQGALDAEPKT